MSLSGGRGISSGSLSGRGARCAAPGLRRAREAAGVSREELAEKTGYTVQTLAALEDGETVHRMNVSRIAAALGVDPALLRGETP